MACIKAPNVLPPAFPAGISLPTLTLPTVPGLGLCCKLILPFPTIPNLPAIPIPAAALAAVNAIFQQVNAALDAVSFKCPLD